MKHEIIPYKADQTDLKGYLVYDSSVNEKRPAILVAHAWRGQDDFARKKAEELASLGYIGFAIDLYGDGKSVDSNEAATALMKPLFIDRKLLQTRILAAYEIMRSHSLVDNQKIGAIGFCFGGLSVIELLRTGVAIRGVVSFHGVLGDTMREIKAIPAIRSKQIDGAILVLHGHDDPLVSLNDIVNLQNELTQAGADWQMNIYGKTQHAFTNPEAHDSAIGLVYNAKTAQRAWLAMTNFFNEIMGEK